jgi:hypothetical protein
MDNLSAILDNVVLGYQGKATSSTLWLLIDSPSSIFVLLSHLSVASTS